MLYVFDDFELDVSHSELRHAGQPLKLERQVFRVLAYLVQHHGQTITKQQLIEHIWTQAVASDWALARCIKLARKILGDDGRRQRIIKTLYSDGYCFVVPVEERGTALRLDTAPTPALLHHSSQTHGPEHGATNPPALPLSQGKPLPGAAALFSGVNTQTGTVARQEHTPDASLVPLVSARRQALWHAIEGQDQEVTVLCGVLASPTSITGPPAPGSTPDLVQEFFTNVLRQVQRYEGIIHHFTDRGFTAIFGAAPAGATRDDSAEPRHGPARTAPGASYDC